MGTMGKKTWKNTMFNGKTMDRSTIFNGKHRKNHGTSPQIQHF
jgi:hypothetical protein